MPYPVYIQWNIYISIFVARACGIKAQHAKLIRLSTIRDEKGLISLLIITQDVLTSAVKVCWRIAFWSSLLGCLPCSPPLPFSISTNTLPSSSHHHHHHQHLPLMPRGSQMKDTSSHDSEWLSLLSEMLSGLCLRAGKPQRWVNFEDRAAFLHRKMVYVCDAGGVCCFLWCLGV